MSYCTSQRGGFECAVYREAQILLDRDSRRCRKPDRARNLKVTAGVFLPQPRPTKPRHNSLRGVVRGNPPGLAWAPENGRVPATVSSLVVEEPCAAYCRPQCRQCVPELAPPLGLYRSWTLNCPMGRFEPGRTCRPPWQHLSHLFPRSVVSHQYPAVSVSRKLFKSETG
jgi:hypothetical protein